MSLKRFINLFCSLIIVSIFSLRWRNCLPFSGFMPHLADQDMLAIYGRYLVYVKEPLTFPLGQVRNLGFPFESTNIAKASIPLFAVPLKLLSKIYPPISDFYFMVLFELVAVFLTAYFTCKILELYQVKSFWMKLLGASLTSLSPSLLFRSSVYYGMPFAVGYFPLYLSYAYFYIRAQKYVNLKIYLILLLILPIASLIDYYAMFGLIIMAGVGLCLSMINLFINPHRKNFITLICFLGSLVLGVILSLGMIFLLGDKENIKITSDISPFAERFSKKWGYGGGYGGGFHVADMLSIFIPPKEDAYTPSWKKVGPNAYLSKLGFPLTTNNLQDGQYEGFTYLGSVVLGIIFLLMTAKFISFLKHPRLSFLKFKLSLEGKFLIKNNFFSTSSLVGISSFVLYIISWGYIFHLGGRRLDNLVTPSLIMAIILPQFMLVRSLGRLAISFMLFVVLVTIIYLNNFLLIKKYNQSLIGLLAIILILIHVNEIKDYLRLSKVVYGNEIINIFDNSDKKLIKNLLKNTKAILTMPAFRYNLDWSKICYALTIESGIPISGATGSLGTVTLSQEKQYNLDLNDIKIGNISAIKKRYGNVAIVTTPEFSQEIIKKMDVSLSSHRLNSKDVIILTINN